MVFSVKRIHHFGIVVRDTTTAERLYVETLGFTRHHEVDSWLVLNDRSTLHLIEIPEAETDEENLYHLVNHVALEVDDLNKVLRRLLAGGRKPFQMDFEGTERAVDNPDDALEFGIGTLFVTDDDGNLLEFLEEGRGLFLPGMRPRSNG